jgi:hypothetical protein
MIRCGYTPPTMSSWHHVALPRRHASSIAVGPIVVPVVDHVFQKSRHPPLPVLRRKIAADNSAAVGKCELKLGGASPPFRKVEERFFSRGWTLSMCASEYACQLGDVATTSTIGCCHERGGISAIPRRSHDADRTKNR